MDSQPFNCILLIVYCKKQFLTLYDKFLILINVHEKRNSKYK